MSIIPINELKDYVSAEGFDADDNVLQSILDASEARIESYLRVSFSTDFEGVIPAPVALGVKILAALIYDQPELIDGNRLPPMVRMAVDSYRVWS